MDVYYPSSVYINAIYHMQIHNNALIQKIIIYIKNFFSPNLNKKKAQAMYESVVTNINKIGSIRLNPLIYRSISRKISQQTKLYGNNPDILLIGSAMLGSGKISFDEKSVINIAVANSTIQQWIRVLQKGEIRHLQPSYLVVHVGMADIVRKQLRLSRRDIVSGFQTFLHLLRVQFPNAKIIVGGLWSPVGLGTTQETHRETKKTVTQITHINDAVQKMSYQHNIMFVDLYKKIQKTHIAFGSTKLNKKGYAFVSGEFAKYF